MTTKDFETTFLLFFSEVFSGVCFEGGVGYDTGDGYDIGVGAGVSV